MIKNKTKQVLTITHDKIFNLDIGFNKSTLKKKTSYQNFLDHKTNYTDADKEDVGLYKVLNYIVFIDEDDQLLITENNAIKKLIYIGSFDYISYDVGLNRNILFNSCLDILSKNTNDLNLIKNINFEGVIKIPNTMITLFTIKIKDKSIVTNKNNIKWLSKNEIISNHLGILTTTSKEVLEALA